MATAVDAIDVDRSSPATVPARCRGGHRRAPGGRRGRGYCRVAVAAAATTDDPERGLVVVAGLACAWGLAGTGSVRRDAPSRSGLLVSLVGLFSAALAGSTADADSTGEPAARDRVGGRGRVPSRARPARRPAPGARAQGTCGRRLRRRLRRRAAERRRRHRRTAIVVLGIACGVIAISGYADRCRRASPAGAPAIAVGRLGRRRCGRARARGLARSRAARLAELAPETRDRRDVVRPVRDRAVVGRHDRGAHRPAARAHDRGRRPRRHGRRRLPRRRARLRRRARRVRAPGARPVDGRRHRGGACTCRCATGWPKSPTGACTASGRRPTSRSRPSARACRVRSRSRSCCCSSRSR